MEDCGAEEDGEETELADAAAGYAEDDEEEDDEGDEEGEGEDEDEYPACASASPTRPASGRGAQQALRSAPTHTGLHRSPRSLAQFNDRRCRG